MAAAPLALLFCEVLVPLFLLGAVGVPLISLLVVLGAGFPLSFSGAEA